MSKTRGECVATLGYALYAIEEAGRRINTHFDCMTNAFNELSLPRVKDVGWNGPVTYVVWDDSSVTRTRCLDGDEYDKEKGLLFCLVKKAFPEWHDIMTEHLWESHE